MNDDNTLKVKVTGFVGCFGYYCTKKMRCTLIGETDLGQANVLRGRSDVFTDLNIRHAVAELKEGQELVNCTDPDNPEAGGMIERYWSGSYHYSII